MKTERRWLKSVLAAAAEPQVALPWARTTRRRPEAFRTAPPAQTPAAAPKSVAAR
ncbi:hypothetical protein NX862_07885 [Rhodobacter sp. KR11]|uniref:hypothetical protein n=1 Tax=Rhodobacter sp. KR11 TaxID=2974588 RepID=UPI0022215B1F|nr:hypothetical protein [Rhodobacter sp. KR11]MCW1918669.1 hypothetical protein [Rhodobacter sp. KR11]